MSVRLFQTSEIVNNDYERVKPKTNRLRDNCKNLEKFSGIQMQSSSSEDQGAKTGHERIPVALNVYT